MTLSPEETSARRRVRLRIIVSLILLIPAGMASKFYSGPGGIWLNHYGAGIFYVTFWCLFIFFLRPEKKNILPVCAAVFAATCLLEFLQLVSGGILMTIRDTFWGRALLGSSFSWLDFPHYLLGAVLGAAWMKLTLGNEGT